MPKVRAAAEGVRGGGEGGGGGGGEGGGGRGGGRKRRVEEELDMSCSSPYFLGSNEQDKASAGSLVLAEVAASENVTHA